jgi:hypothetical protein
MLLMLLYVMASLACRVCRSRAEYTTSIDQLLAFLYSVEADGLYHISCDL